MSPAAGPTSASDRHQLTAPEPICPPGAEMVAKDAILTWYRGEFAAANAIIDALCNHITDLSASRSSDYDAVFAAIHRRRLNWIPVLQMQKYFSITDVATELRKVANKPLLAQTAMVNDNKIDQDDDKTSKKLQINEPLQGGEDANSDGNAGFTDPLDEDSPDSEITDTGEAFNLLEQLGQPVSAPAAGTSQPLASGNAGVDEGLGAAATPQPLLSQPISEHFSRDAACYPKLKDRPSVKDSSKSSSRHRGEKRKSGDPSRSESHSKKKHRRDKEVAGSKSAIVVVDPDLPPGDSAKAVLDAIPIDVPSGGDGMTVEATLQEFFVGQEQARSFLDASTPIPRAVRALYEESPSRDQLCVLIGQLTQLAVSGSSPHGLQGETLVREANELREKVKSQAETLGKLGTMMKIEADDKKKLVDECQLLTEELKTTEAKLNTVSDQLKAKDQEIAIIRSRVEVVESSLSSKEKEYALLKNSFDHMERELKEVDADYSDKLKAEAERAVQEFVGSRRFTQRMDYYAGYRYGLLDLMYRTQLKLKGIDDFVLNYKDPLGYPTDPPPFHPSIVGTFTNDGDSPLEAWQPVELDRATKITPGCEGTLHDPLETLRNGFAKVSLLQAKKEGADSTTGDV